MYHKKTLLSIVITLVLLLISACSDQPTELANTQTAIPEPTSTKIPEATQTHRPTTAPTFTESPLPTKTSAPTNTPVPTATLTALPKGVELINLRTSDGIDLVGYLHRPETSLDEGFVVVLAHGHTQSHTEWDSFEELLIKNGIDTMTFDFRGHGASGGTDQFSTIGIDVKTVFDYVKRQGYERIVCIGASLGGSACLAAAIDAGITGLVMLSSPMNLQGGPRLVSKQDLQNLAIPKIFMFTENDVWVPADAILSYYETAEVAAEPKEIYVYPGPAHGTGMFYDEDGEDVISILLDFVIDLSK
jgi:pimeloyl-ACP methyl ester carboxylesterase